MIYQKGAVLDSSLFLYFPAYFPQYGLTLQELFIFDKKEIGFVLFL